MTPQRNHNQPVNEGFSATNYRQAMGPGYPIALFKEQGLITGQQPVHETVRPTIDWFALLDRPIRRLAALRTRRRTTRRPKTGVILQKSWVS